MSGTDIGYAATRLRPKPHRRHYNGAGGSRPRNQMLFGAVCTECGWLVLTSGYGAPSAGTIERVSATHIDIAG
eukprot:227705-Rhodomonas_salina.1